MKLYLAMAFALTMLAGCNSKDAQQTAPEAVEAVSMEAANSAAAVVTEATSEATSAAATLMTKATSAAVAISGAVAAPKATPAK